MTIGLPVYRHGLFIFEHSVLACLALTAATRAAATAAAGISFTNAIAGKKNDEENDEGNHCQCGQKDGYCPC